VPEAVLWEQNRMAVEAARPRTVRPVAGVLTSNFGVRWGALHAGAARVVLRCYPRMAPEWDASRCLRFLLSGHADDRHAFPS
jgi:hypothetical protein